MFSEKDMEDQIAAAPAKFIQERDLTLFARQFRIGSYIFDLVFRDRHGGKLIVEIQKGTLDRAHTYKILDYYFEYQDRYPHEFVDLMVIANQIPLERKKRLQSWGIEYREIPPAEFLPLTDQETHLATASRDHVSPLQQIPAKAPGAGTSICDAAVPTHYFTTLGRSAFVRAARDELTRILPPEIWRIGGKDSLTARLLPATMSIETVRGKGLAVQLWMERPKQGRGVCKLEVASKTAVQTDEESVRFRTQIAAALRSRLMRSRPPTDVKPATGSTIVALPFDVGGIESQVDDDERRASIYRKQIERIGEFATFLDGCLHSWIWHPDAVGEAGNET